MDSNGLMVPQRVLFLVILLSTFCLHLSVCEESEDKGEGQGAEVKEEDDPWDTDKFRKEADQTYNLLFFKYSNRIRPPVPYVEIDLAVTLSHIRHFDVDRQELQIILDLEVNWMDSRLYWLPYKVKEIHESADQIWHPDLVYLNSIAPVEELYPNIVRIVHNGSISWIRKEIVTTRCETDLTSSVQTCPIKMGFATNSLDDNDQDLFFFSDKTTATVADGELFTHNWRLDSFEVRLGDENDTMSSTLDLDLVLRRTKSESKGGEHKGDNPGNYAHHTTDHRVTDSDAQSSSTQDDCNTAVSASSCCSVLLLFSCVIGAWLVGAPMADRAGS